MDKTVNRADTEWTAEDFQSTESKLRAALEEIKTICSEDQAACRRRMGTRVGNVLAVAMKALAE